MEQYKIDARSRFTEFLVNARGYGIKVEFNPVLKEGGIVQDTWVLVHAAPHSFIEKLVKNYRVSMESVGLAVDLMSYRQI